jgi:hypothetical protein
MVESQSVMTDRNTAPNLDGLHINITAGRIYVYVADRLVWAGSKSEWSYALANPTK